MDLNGLTDVEVLQQWRTKMTKPEQNNEPAGTQTGAQERSPARAKDQDRPADQKDKDLPGADGPITAGAEEDTYD